MVKKRNCGIKALTNFNRKIFLFIALPEFQTAYAIEDRVNACVYLPKEDLTKRKRQAR